jgi:hypothetical protein
MEMRNEELEMWNEEGKEKKNNEYRTCLPAGRYSMLNTEVEIQLLPNEYSQQIKKPLEFPGAS